MRIAALDDDRETQSTRLQFTAADRHAPLRQCVEEALGFYLDNMAGHEITNLRELVLEEVERPMFETVLRFTNGNLSQAAKMLGMTRATLRKRLALYGIDRLA
ncbi:Fis family transcriptional regulator [Thiocapsa imhoffii]|uniref:Putative Fis-like DNA-binding protein n=1 Tax=Thiocapsa imhoffii TaxID=382777 RepID=A0A9X0WFU4_9GAMM|nr:helix-turn-helix domain-containing protein [Thiocapsa imhoffii]MBK1643720.1 Fis family transcriptional regulator [Thiocapsa imhoffii]